MAESPRELLERLGLKPKHSWGQNFLGDAGVLDRIADEAMLVPGDVVLELGAGLGHLTEHLLATGATVVAVERDRDLVAALEGRKLLGLTVVAANAADLNFAKTAGVDDVVVVGNLPYHLTSPILFEVLDQAAHVKRAVFTLQKEVVNRLCAPAGTRDGGLLTVLLGLRFHVEACFDVPSHFFHPPPKVDSGVIRLARRSTPAAQVVSELRFRRVVKAGFAHRRKTLLNSLKGDKELGDAATLAAALETAGIDARRRAETLTVAEFAALERALGPEAAKP